MVLSRAAYGVRGNRLPAGISWLLCVGWETVLTVIAVLATSTVFTRLGWGGGNGVKAVAIHGDRSQSQRNQALKGFQDGYYRVLVATDVAARGIHVDGIAHVVNYDLPQVPEDFIHRVGRTARAGARGTASTFAMRSERADITRIERTLSIRLKRCEVSAAIPREVKQTAPVIVMPPAPQRDRRWQKFAPKRQARRAV